MAHGSSSNTQPGAGTTDATNCNTFPTTATASRSPVVGNPRPAASGKSSKTSSAKNQIPAATGTKEEIGLTVKPTSPSSSPQDPPTEQDPSPEAQNKEETLQSTGFPQATPHQPTRDSQAGPANGPLAQALQSTPTTPPQTAENLQSAAAKQQSDQPAQPAQPNQKSDPTATTTPPPAQNNNNLLRVPPPQPPARPPTPPPAVDHASLQRQLAQLQAELDEIKSKGLATNQCVSSFKTFIDRRVAEVQGKLTKEVERVEEKVEKVEKNIREVEKKVGKAEKSVAGMWTALCHSVVGLLRSLAAEGGGLPTKGEEGASGWCGIVTGRMPEERQPGEDGGLGNEGDRRLGDGNESGNDAERGGGEEGGGGIDSKKAEDREPDDQEPDDQTSSDEAPEANHRSHTNSGPVLPPSPVQLRPDDDEGEPGDGSVNDEFDKLEIKITALVVKCFPGDVDDEVARRVAGGRWASRFPRDSWGAHKSARLAWFRALVADLIHAELFAKPLFGCDDAVVENGLAAFEQLMAPGGQRPADLKQRQDLVRWRALTTRMLDRPDRKLTLARRLDTQLRDAFSTVLALNLNPKDLNKLLTQLCKKAVDCALVVRKSRASYLWLQADEWESAPGDKIELVGARLGGAGVPAGDEECKVVFTVFGALVKDDAEIEEGGRRFTDCITLRKPRVVVA